MIGTPVPGNGMEIQEQIAIMAIMRPDSVKVAAFETRGFTDVFGSSILVTFLFYIAYSLFAALFEELRH